MEGIRLVGALIDLKIIRSYFDQGPDKADALQSVFDGMTRERL